MGLIQILNRKYGKTVVAATHDAKAAEFAMHQLHLDKRQLPDSPSRTAA
jgi:putative ABC transport system ATP-binding protein